MKQEFILYFDLIGITATQVRRIREIENFYSIICPDEIEEVLITDFIDEEGRRQYESLWFFSEKYAMEAKKFLTEDDFDIVPYRRRMEYLNIKKKNYEIGDANDASRISVHVNIGAGLARGISGDFQASGENCEVFWKFTKEYLVPNLVDNVSDAEVHVLESEV